VDLALLEAADLWLHREQAGSGAMLTLTSLTIWLPWEQSGSSEILALTSLTIWLRCEQAGNSGSGFTARGETSFAGSSGSGFARSKLVVVDLSSLVRVKVASLGRSW